VHIGKCQSKHKITYDNELEKSAIPATASSMPSGSSFFKFSNVNATLAREGSFGTVNILVIEKRAYMTAKAQKDVRQVETWEAIPDTSMPPT
jgi:hypothetical protein